jgi:outer membrane protein assembly factor BamB
MHGLWCLDAASGDLIWRYFTPSGLGSPAISARATIKIDCLGIARAVVGNADRPPHRRKLLTQTLGK